MRQKIFKIILPLLIILFIGGFIYEIIPDETMYSFNVIHTFGKDSKKQHNFSWITSKEMNVGSIEYCEKKHFVNFKFPNITTKKADSNLTRTDNGDYMVHKVELNNLKTNTEYVYRVKSNDLYSETGFFVTASDSQSSFSFIQITDIQASSPEDYNVWRNTLTTALFNYPESKFLLLTGDIVNNGDNINQWNWFANSANKQLMNLTLVPVVGNHDAININGTNSNLKNFTDRFNLAKEKNSGAVSGTVYSFDYENVHIAVLNTENGEDNFDIQMNWLKKDMLNTNKKWKIVALHRGPYGGPHDSVDIRTKWTPTFDELGIDLVLAGHDHNYIRSYSLKDNKKQSVGNGTIYITANSGGVKFYPIVQKDWQEVNIQPNLGTYVAVTVNEYQIMIRAHDVKGNLIDEYYFNK